jgi:CubicO group peptidase (beta-lactamase class C family)
VKSASAATTDGGRSIRHHRQARLNHCQREPGLSIATIEGGSLQWAGSFGVKDTESQQTVTSRTIFPAASLSKVVFAYAVLKLADQGDLELDDPLSKYVPGYVENDERVNLITARQVLTHRTGFPNWRPRNRPLAIQFNPGERFSYSGEGFIYLQRPSRRLPAKRSTLS